MLVLALLLAACVGVRAGVFNVTYLDVPEVVWPGQQQVEFECRYGGNFSVLSWFKGNQEFFRYRPGAAPSTRSFPIIGVGTVEMITCGPAVCQLRLGELTEHASGMYRCDIERDVKPYKFATLTAHMEVRGHELRKPLLEGIQTEYTNGDMIEAYCRGASDTELRWYINGEELEEFRGVSHLKMKGSRFLFKGEPRTMSLQCAEFKYGNICGSVSRKAYWNEKDQMRIKRKEDEVKNGSSAITGTLGLQSTLLYFLVKVINV